MRVTTPRSPSEEDVPGDLRMVGALWPVLLASAAGLVPFTVFSTFLVPIARNADTSMAVMGGLRGLGGLAALLVGTAFAPLVDRVPTRWLATGGLVLLGTSSVVGAVGEFAALVAFCLLIGTSTAILNPALATAAADHYGTGAAAGRAATLLTATQSLTAMLAAPVLSLPALLWGWRGDLIAIAGLSGVLAVVLFARERGNGAGRPGTRAGYLASFRALAAVPGAVALLLIGLLRTASFMGYLAYLAAFYAQRFALSPEVFAFVWTLSGASFFVGNLLIGRLINAVDARMPAERIMVLGLVAATVSLVGFYFAPILPVALAWTALLAASHATVAACVVTLLVRRCGELRGSALSVNAAGMSLGVFIGAAVGGVGLGFAGYAGVAATLGGLSVLALVVSVLVPAKHGAEPSEVGR